MRFGFVFVGFRHFTNLMETIIKLCPCYDRYIQTHVNVPLNHNSPDPVVLPQILPACPARTVYDNDATTVHVISTALELLLDTSATYTTSTVKGHTAINTHPIVSDRTANTASLESNQEIERIILKAADRAAERAANKVAERCRNEFTDIMMKQFVLFNDHFAASNAELMQDSSRVSLLEERSHSESRLESMKKSTAPHLEPKSSEINLMVLRSGKRI